MQDKPRYQGTGEHVDSQFYILYKIHLVTMLDISCLLTKAFFK